MVYASNNVSSVPLLHNTSQSGLEEGWIGSRSSPKQRNTMNPPFFWSPFRPPLFNLILCKDRSTLNRWCWVDEMKRALFYLSSVRN